MSARLVRLIGAAWFLAVLTLVMTSAPSAQAADLKLRAYLVWGTDDPKPPAGKDYKAADAEIEKKLRSLPLKWQHYFEVSRTNFVVSPSAPTKVSVSGKCEIEVKGGPNSIVDVVMRNKGEEVARQKQPLPSGQYLIVSGNAPNSSGWFVVLKREE
jgi:hypothetical protein